MTGIMRGMELDDAIPSFGWNLTEPQWLSELRVGTRFIQTDLSLDKANHFIFRSLLEGENPALRAAVLFKEKAPANLLEAKDSNEFCPEMWYAFHIGKNSCGHPGFVHGGLIGTLIDETFGVTSHQTSGPGHFTANLSIDYVKPLPYDQWILIKSQVSKKDGRKLYLQSRVEIGDTLYAKGTALFIKPRDPNAPQPPSVTSTVPSKSSASSSAPLVSSSSSTKVAPSAISSSPDVPPPKGAVAHAFIPYLHSDNANASVEFYQKLGFEVSNSHKDGDMYMFAMLHVPGTQARLIITPSHSKETINPDQQAVLFYVWTTNLVALRDKLISNGLQPGAISYPPHMPGGQFSIPDPDRFNVVIGQPSAA